MDETEKGMILGAMKQFMVSTTQDITEIKVGLKEDIKYMKKDIRRLHKFKVRASVMMAFVLGSADIGYHWLKSKLGG